MTNTRFFQDDIVDSVHARAMWQLNYTIGDPGLREHCASMLAQEVLHELPQDLRQIPEDITKVEALQSDGFCIFDHTLSKDAIAEIRSYFDGVPTKETRHNQVYYDTEDVFRAPYLIEFMTSEALLNLVHAYLKVPGTINDVAVWRSQPMLEKPTGNEIFHRDRGGFRQCKLFLYLTDVNEDNGPHQYVMRSIDFQFVEQCLANRRIVRPTAEELFMSRRRYPKFDMEQLFGDAVVTLLGEAGSCFLTNNYGLHRGLAVERGERLIFQVLYSLTSHPDPKQMPGRVESVVSKDVASFMDRLPENLKAHYATRLITRLGEDQGCVDCPQ